MSKRKSRVKKSLFGTGHRPDKLGGYARCPLHDWLLDQAVVKLKALNPSKVYVGMAQGWDWILSRACISLDIPFIACVPFQGQEKLWPQETRIEYHTLLQFSQEVVEVSEPGYEVWKLHKRNRYMVDHGDEGLSCWNGDLFGGTYGCLQYAKEQKKVVYNVDPNLFQATVEDIGDFDDDDAFVDIPF